MIDLLLSKHASRLFALFAFLIPFFVPPSAFRPVVTAIVILLLLGFIPIHEMLSRKQVVNKSPSDETTASANEADPVEQPSGLIGAQNQDPPAQPDLPL